MQYRAYEDESAARKSEAGKNPAGRQRPINLMEECVVH